MNDEISEPATSELTIEQLSDAQAGSFCVGTVGTAGCPSSAGSVGTASSS
ncbi:hypothetical protein GCM10022222_18680 [Amycolatopsis ultiminotia]|uniref:Thiocillin family RiPP n=1 Tax=Amycolatopsis ultiminotia TaxID=543629 RepID=A0ABP6VHY2_9PSEU